MKCESRFSYRWNFYRSYQLFNLQWKLWFVRVYKFKVFVAELRRSFNEPRWHFYWMFMGWDLARCAVKLVRRIKVNQAFKFGHLWLQSLLWLASKLQRQLVKSFESFSNIPAFSLSFWFRYLPILLASKWIC